MGNELNEANTRIHFLADALAIQTGCSISEILDWSQFAYNNLDEKGRWISLEDYIKGNF
jgi:hypothetical protein